MGIAYGAHGVWSCHSAGMGFVQPEWKFVPYDWEEGLRLPGAWDVALARWLFEQYDLFDVDPVDLLAREDAEVRASASADRDKVALYMPHAYDVALKMDLGGYRCQVFDLEHRRPLVPAVETGNTSVVRASMYNGDVLFLASR